MTIKSFGMTLAAGLALLAFSTPAKADINPSLDFSGGSVQDVPGAFSLGYQFTVGSLPFEVTAVGLWSGTLATGETVRIFEDGTTTNLLSQSISASDPLSSSGKYNYVTLATPVLLQANTTYNLLADLNPGNKVVLQVSAFSNDPDISYVKPVGDYGSGLFLSDDNVHLGPYFGGTFEGHTVAVGAVPEPSSTLLFATMAGLVLLLLNKRVKKQA